MSNFTFLPPEFRAVAEAASRAEGHVMDDPRAACFHAHLAELDVLFSSRRSGALNGEL